MTVRLYKRRKRYDVIQLDLINFRRMVCGYEHHYSPFDAQFHHIMKSSTGSYPVKYFLVFDDENLQVSDILEFEDFI